MKKVKIYPLTDYNAHKLNSIEGNMDSLYVRNYVIYNLTEPDTASLKKAAATYIDSIVKHNSRFKAFQLQFYKKSNTLDTNYSENEYNPLFAHEKDQAGIYRLTADGSSWLFYKDGKIINGGEITIEDIPENKGAGKKK